MASIGKEVDKEDFAYVNGVVVSKISMTTHFGASGLDKRRRNKMIKDLDLETVPEDVWVAWIDMMDLIYLMLQGEKTLEQVQSHIKKCEASGLFREGVYVVSEDGLNKRF